MGNVIKGLVYEFNRFTKYYHGVIIYVCIKFKIITGICLCIHINFLIIGFAYFIYIRIYGIGGVILNILLIYAMGSLVVLVFSIVLFVSILAYYGGNLYIPEKFIE